jgi:hypothetical protein
MTPFCTYLPMSVEGEEKENLIFLHASTVRTSISPPPYMYIHDMLKHRRTCFLFLSSTTVKRRKRCCCLHIIRI